MLIVVDIRDIFFLDIIDSAVDVDDDLNAADIDGDVSIKAFTCTLTFNIKIMIIILHNDDAAAADDNGDDLVVHVNDCFCCFFCFTILTGLAIIS